MLFRAIARVGRQRVAAVSSLTRGKHGISGGEYVVSKEKLEAFHRDGYVTLEGFLTEKELQPIEKIYDAVLRGEIMNQAVHKKDFCDMSQPFGTPFEKWGIVNAMLPTRYIPAMQVAAQIYHCRAASVSRQLFPDATMVMDYDQLLCKRPQKERAVFPWHQDMAYWPATPDTRTATFSLAIDPTTAENGALRFVRGSQLSRTVFPHTPVGKRDENHAVAVEVDEQRDPVVMLCAARGDVTVHDEYVVHGSGGNLSQGPRRTFVMAFRTAHTVAAERAAGFSHSHNDEVNWDTFEALGMGSGAYKETAK